MKKLTLLFVLALGALLVLSACGSAPAPTPEVVVVKVRSSPSIRPGW